MMRGSIGLELVVTAEADQFGVPYMVEIEIDGHVLSAREAAALWAQLPADYRHVALANAMEDAEDAGDDDAACDEARMPGAAE